MYLVNVQTDFIGFQNRDFGATSCPSNSTQKMAGKMSLMVEE
jgi:hypothetical protein